MRWNRDWRVDSGYIGCCYREAEFKLFAALLRSHGIPVRRVGKYSTMGITISLYTAQEHVRRAREIRRGFKAGLLVRGDPLDFVLGVRAALVLRSARSGAPALPCGAIEPPVSQSRRVLPHGGGGRG
jgi:hypothetical protein